MRSINLAYLTYAHLEAPDAIKLASEVGFDGVGIRILPAFSGGTFSPLLTDKRLLRETLKNINELSMPVFDVEIVRIKENFKIEDYLHFLEISGLLGARSILLNGDDPDLSRTTDSFALLCEYARPYGLTCSLEFMSFTRVPNAKVAIQIVRNAGQPNGRILPDSLHVARSETTLEELKEGFDIIDYIQICDAPAKIPETNEELIHAARSERLLPGDGELQLQNFIHTFPPHIAISIEVPNIKNITDLGQLRWCELSLSHTQKLI